MVLVWGDFWEVPLSMTARYPLVRSPGEVWGEGGSVVRSPGEVWGGGNVGRFPVRSGGGC